LLADFEGSLYKAKLENAALPIRSDDIFYTIPETLESEFTISLNYPRIIIRRHLALPHVLFYNEIMCISASLKRITHVS